jgi:energy-coupling factor transport system substrate-specific component
MTEHRRTARNAAYLGVSLAILEAAKLTLDLRPNIEVVTLLFIFYTIFRQEDAPCGDRIHCYRMSS